MSGPYRGRTNSGGPTRYVGGMDSEPLVKPKPLMGRLVAASYGEAERQRYMNHEAREEEKLKAAQTGKEVLHASVRLPLACTFMTAAWVSRLRSEQGLPAYCVAGDLHVGRRPVFASGDRDVARRFDASTLDWQGHCWLVLGNLIGDISVCRTAYAQPDGSHIKNSVLRTFGAGRGLFLMPRGILLEDGFEYTPKYVVTDRQMTALVETAKELGALHG